MLWDFSPKGFALLAEGFPLKGIIITPRYLGKLFNRHSLLSYDTGSTKTALNVLERSLHSLSELTLSETDCIPEDMITYWYFSAKWLTERIPTFDEFDLVKVEQFLIRDEGINSPSPDLIKMAA